MPEVKLTAELRTEFGKGAARRIRRADKVPAVLYGHGTDPIHITLPGHETLLALRQANALLSIDVNGSSQLALPKQVQRDPSEAHRSSTSTCSWSAAARRSPSTSGILLEGEAAPDTLVDVVANTVSVEAEATHIPQQITVSIEGLAAGTQILARDLQLPEGSTVQRRSRGAGRQHHQRPDDRRGRGRAGRGRGGGRHRADRRRGHRGCRGRGHRGRRGVRRVLTHGVRMAGGRAR